MKREKNQQTVMPPLYYQRNGCEVLQVEGKYQRLYAACMEKSDAAKISDAMNAHERLEAVAQAAARLMSCIGEDLPCECHGKPDAIYKPGEKCPPCELKDALKNAGKED